MEPTKTDADELYQPLLDELAQLNAAYHKSVNLRGKEEAGVRTLRHGLHSFELQHATFDYLSCTSTEFTVALVDDLVNIARSQRYNEAIRQILGRLTYQEALKVVPPAVFKIVEVDHIGPDPIDDDDWRRMAELLYYLGLLDALEELCRRARDHLDEGIREVAEDFSD